VQLGKSVRSFQDAADEFSEELKKEVNEGKEQKVIDAEVEKKD